MLMSEPETDGTEWEFQEGDILREQHEPHAPGGVGLGNTEYLIKWQLRRETKDKRCYLVEKEEGGTHLYTAPAIEGLYEVIPPEESRVWSEEDADEYATGTDR